MIKEIYPDKELFEYCMKEDRILKETGHAYINWKNPKIIGNNVIISKETYDHINRMREADEHLIKSLKALANII